MSFLFLTFALANTKYIVSIFSAGQVYFHRKIDNSLA